MLEVYILTIGIGVISHLLTMSHFTFENFSYGFKIVSRKKECKYKINVPMIYLIYFLPFSDDSYSGFSKTHPLVYFTRYKNVIEGSRH